MPWGWEKRITPFRCHAPPGARIDGISQRTAGGSPRRLTFFSVPFAKNPRYWLSGDQNGPSAPSVPVSSRAVNESKARTQSRVSSPGRDARNARKRPFGDTARNDADGLNVVPSGGVTMNRRTAGVLDDAARK